MPWVSFNNPGTVDRGIPEADEKPTGLGSCVFVIRILTYKYTKTITNKLKSQPSDFRERRLVV